MAPSRVATHGVAVDEGALNGLIQRQAQVLSRTQVYAGGGNDADVARKIRRREWVAVHPGVYVAHTGPLTTEQQEWAAVLYYWPAALAGTSALRAHGLARDSRLEAHAIHLVVARDRRVTARPGVRLTRQARFDADVQHHFSPPRVRVEHAVLDTAAALSREAAAVAVLADAVQSRRTTVERLLSALELRPRLRHRALLRDVLRDLDGGAHSVLERHYLQRASSAGTACRPGSVSGGWRSRAAPPIGTWSTSRRQRSSSSTGGSATRRLWTDGRTSSATSTPPSRAQ